MNRLNLKSKQNAVNISAIAFKIEFYDTHFLSPQGHMELYLHLTKGPCALFRLCTSYLDNDWIATAFASRLGHTHCQHKVRVPHQVKGPWESRIRHILKWRDQLRAPSVALTSVLPLVSIRAL